MIRQARALLRVGGEWVHAHAKFGDMEVVDRHTGGPWSLTWQMNLPPGERPTWLSEGATVELYAGTLRWSGTLADPDWEAGSFTADGWCRQAETAAALSGGGATNSLSVAITQAGPLGRKVIDFDTKVTGAADKADDELWSIAQLADQYCLENSGVWRVGVHREFYIATEPPAPSMWVLPGIVDLSTSVATSVRRVLARYIDTSLTHRLAISDSNRGRGEAIVDLTAKGPILEATATAVANQMLARSGGGEPRFTTGFEVHAGQVVDESGPVDLSRIIAGQMIRIHGCTDPRNGLPWTDILIGETQWRPQESTVQINPVELDAADFTGIVEELGGSVVFS